MIIRVRHHRRNFTVISNDAIRDQKLSLSAKGLHHLLLSYSDDFRISINGCASLTKEGRDKIAKCLNELIQYGYLVRKKTRVKGKFMVTYELYETPDRVLPDQQTRSGDTDLVNPDNSNNKRINTKSKNTTFKEAVLSKLTKETLWEYDNKKYSPLEFQEWLMKNLSERYSPLDSRNISCAALRKLHNSDLDNIIISDIERYLRSLGGDEDETDYYSKYLSEI